MPSFVFRGVAFLLTLGSAASAYSVLTHEAIIDSAWARDIQPLLLKRFPRASSDELLHAHAYAYGGCIIQDMGYYPFGSKFFSDLTHYVRSGDFIVSLIRDSNDLNEYAFALGALAHYAADNNGHAIAINRVVPMLYPKLRAEFGPEVTYADNPAAHMKAELGFDVLQVAGGSYAPKAYHDFIGFEVSQDLLDRALQDTYALKLGDVFRNVDLAIGTYRFAVSSLIPETTKVAWELKKDEIEKLAPDIKREKFIYRLSRASYKKEWDGRHRKPGIGAKLLAFVLRIVPKVGPFKPISFKPPTPEAERLFVDSFNRSLDQYRRLLAETGRDRLVLRDTDFDTGRPTAAGEYRLADQAYSNLLRKLAERNFAGATPALRDNLLSFYKNAVARAATLKHDRHWEKTSAALEKLKSFERQVADRREAGE